MNNNIKISIIMSVYNNEKYLDEAISSILRQSYTNFEFIITNDASKDRSLEIIQKYSKADKRIKIIDNKENIGLTKSLNNMIDMCRGEYIARMDGDDISIFDRLEKQMNVLLSNRDIDIIFSDTTLIDQNSNIICNSWRPNSIEKILKWLELNNFIPHPTIIIKKSVLSKFKYNPNIKTGQDHDLWVRLKKQNYRFYYLKESLLLYRINPNSVRGENMQGYYTIARQCINNNNKKSVLKYLNKLNFKEKLMIITKLIIPYKLLLYKGFLIRWIKLRG